MGGIGGGIVGFLVSRALLASNGEFGRVSRVPAAYIRAYSAGVQGLQGAREPRIPSC